MPDLFGGFDPSPNQMDIVQDEHQLFVVAGNRGSRKTTACLWKYCDLAINYEFEGFIGRFHRKYLYETTYALWRKLFPAKEWQHIFEAGGGKGEEEPDYIKFASGTKIHLIPMSDIERVRGGNFGMFLIDQLEECNQGAWADSVKVLRGEVWEKFNDRGIEKRRDVGAMHRRGMATINKKRGWYWIKRLFIDHIGFDRKPLAPEVVERMRIKELPYDENKKFWAEGYYDNIIANAQSQAEIDFEVYGKDPSAWGLVFPEFDRDTHMKAFEFSDPELREAVFYLGYDEGFDVPSAFMFCAVTPDGTHWVRAEHYAAGMGLAAHAEKLHEIAARIGFPLDEESQRSGRVTLIADPSISGKKDGDGVSITDQWAPLGFFWNNGSRNEKSGHELMRTLMMPDADKRVKFVVHKDDCPNLAEELSDAYYDEEDPKGGKILKRCKMHAVDGVRYFVLEARTPRKFIPKPSLDSTWHQVLNLKSGQGWLAPSSYRGPWMVPE